MWIIKFTKNAEKDKKLLKSAGLEDKVKKLLNLIAKNPFQNPPSYEKLVGDLQGYGICSFLCSVERFTFISSINSGLE